MLRTATTLLCLLGLAPAVTACIRSEPRSEAIVPGGDPDRGRALIAAFDCGGCHKIPGVAGANGMAGPPLTGVAQRTFIAGMLANTPDNMERWVESPQSVIPGNAMPNMGINDHDARDVAAYLYTLR